MKPDALFLQPDDLRVRLRVMQELIASFEVETVGVDIIAHCFK